MPFAAEAITLTIEERRTGEAKSVFLNAAQQEKALGYCESPNYIRPVGETEGAAMTTVGDWADAKTAYEQALLERPRSGFALYGVAVSNEKSGNAEAAAGNMRICLRPGKMPIQLSPK